MYCGFHNNKKTFVINIWNTQLFSTLIIILGRNVSGAANHHTRMISDTEDWSIDCFDVTAINYIWKYIKISGGHRLFFLI